MKQGDITLIHLQYVITGVRIFEDKWLHFYLLFGLLNAI